MPQVTVPTNAFGTVAFGSIDVTDGNLTHVSGKRGGMWLSVQKLANDTPPTVASVYLAYADQSSAPHVCLLVRRRYGGPTLEVKSVYLCACLLP